MAGGRESGAFPGCSLDPARCETTCLSRWSDPLRSDPPDPHTLFTLLTPADEVRLPRWSRAVGLSGSMRAIPFGIGLSETDTPGPEKVTQQRFALSGNNPASRVQVAIGAPLRIRTRRSDAMAFGSRVAHAPQAVRLLHPTALYAPIPRRLARVGVRSRVDHRLCHRRPIVQRSWCVDPRYAIRGRGRRGPVTDATGPVVSRRPIRRPLAELEPRVVSRRQRDQSRSSHRSHHRQARRHRDRHRDVRGSEREQRSGDGALGEVVLLQKAQQPLENATRSGRDELRRRVATLLRPLEATAVLERRGRVVLREVRIVHRRL